MKILKILSILLFFPYIGFSQFIIKGQVTDVDSQEPIPNVFIQVPTLEKNTFTDIDGKFEIKNIPLKKIELFFLHQGYEKTNKIIEFKQKEIYLNIKLKHSPLELDEIILSTGLNKLQKDNVMKVSHRSLKAMEEKGIQNLLDGMAQIPGVKKMNTGVGINKPVIRGLTGNRVLVYNQGVKMENYQFGEKHGMDVDPSGIRAVEVIKGPASLLYGSDALGGVVYLIPEKYAPAHQNKTDINSKYFSNTQGFYTSAGHKTSGQNWKFLSRIAYNKNGEYQIPDKRRVVNSSYNSFDTKLGVSYTFNNIDSDLRYNFNQNQNGIPLYTASKNIDFEPIGEYQDVKNHLISLKNKIDFDQSKLFINIGYSNVRRTLVKTSQRLIDMRLENWSLDAKYYFPEKNNWEIITGWQSEFKTNKNFNSNQLLPNAEVFSTGIFGNFNYTYLNTIVQTGIRYDFRNIDTETVNQYRPALNKSFNSITGALGVKTSVTPLMDIRFNIASGFRAPNLSELTSYGEHVGRIEVGNPNLKNEQNIQTDINWEFKTTHIEFFVNTFYNRIYNYIYLSPKFGPNPPNSLPVYEYAQNNAKLYGGEAGIHFHPHPLKWLHINSSFETVIGKKDNGLYLPLIPADTWNNEVRIMVDSQNKNLKKYFFGIEINKIYDARTNLYEKEYPGYTVLNASLGTIFSIKKTKMVLTASAQNLTNKTYMPVTSTLSKINIPNPGRNFILNFKVSF